MAKRFYTAQFCDALSGWTDIPGGASLKESASNAASEEFARQYKIATRVIRKPKGWTPPETSTETSTGVHIRRLPDVGKQARESRKLKL